MWRTGKGIKQGWAKLNEGYTRKRGRRESKMERMDIWARMVDEYRPTAIIISQGYPSQYTNSSRDRQPAS